MNDVDNAEARLSSSVTLHGGPVVLRPVLVLRMNDVYDAEAGLDRLPTGPTSDERLGT